MAITDKFSKVSNGSQALPTTLSADKNAGATTASLNAATGWDTTAAKHVRMYKTKVVNGQTVPDTTQLCYYKATLAGTTLSNITLIYSSTGSDQKFVIGDSVDLAPNTGWADDLIDGILTQHKQDGTHDVVTATSVDTASQGSLKDGSIAISTARSELMFDHVASGCVLTGTGYGSTLAWSMTSGVVYIGGKRLTVNSASGTVTASKDTYFDLLNPGTGNVATLVNTGGNIVANNAASPTLAASSVRLGIIVSGANIASVASINQGQEDKLLPIASSVPYAVTDSLGNLICPRDPNRKLLSFRKVNTSQGTFTGETDLTGVSITFISDGLRKVKISYRSNGQSSIAGDVIQTNLKESTTVLDFIYSVISQASLQENPNAQFIVTPTAGTHTYKLTMQRALGTGNITNASSTSIPTYIMAELV